MKRQLVYTGEGIYEPTIQPEGILWQRNTDNDPLYGVYVEDADHACEVAMVFTVDNNGSAWRYHRQDESQLYGELNLHGGYQL